MAVPKGVSQLIETFHNNLDYYKSSSYNEAQLRQEFLDPFFRELGWDMDNTAGLAPQYRDVIHEASIKVAGSTKAPDYAFTIHGQYKFFLEAKKPSVNVQSDVEPAYQLRRYGWSAKLPISILTDFEEFSIYDCRKRPRRGDRASKSRIGYFKYTDYEDKWDELSSTFTKSAILKGSFDKYTVDSKRHRGTDTVDDVFLEEIEEWRSLLAKNLARRNPLLTVRDLNFAVQKTIDRIIFLRICEDRGTEDYKRLHTVLGRKNIYPRLLEQFLEADQRYNSGLFHFSNQPDRSNADNLTPSLQLDDRVLEDIISKLYYPESPYEFSVLPADILGQVYEQFLGKTIHLTPGHQAKIEEKPEVRKAGGVYYTPSHIVDYIVEKTVGELLNGPDPEIPKPISVSKAAEIKILDPACGSGSFLIIAYQFLLDWHLRQYTTDPDSNEPNEGKIKRHSNGRSPKLYQAPGGEWKLTTDERKRILLNNIFGVDIDAQAVEVTKLSLLLKVLEGETQQVLQRDWMKERQRILPDLGDNIKCGNTLVGQNFYDNEQMMLLDEEEQYRVNVFDWPTAFSAIMERGGFDCIVGNPPYVFGGSKGIEQHAKRYFKDNYESGSGKVNLFAVFIESGVRQLKENGVLSFIIPNTYLRVTSYKKARNFILKNSIIKEIADLGAGVFTGATTSSIILTLERGLPTSENKITIKDGLETVLHEHVQGQYSAPDCVINLYETADDARIVRRLKECSLLLDEMAEELIFGVVISGNIDELVIDTHEPDTQPFVEGRDVERYGRVPRTKFLRYIPSAIHRPRTRAVFEAAPKILIKRITGGLRPLNATIDYEKTYNKESINNLILKKDIEYSELYILGLINSKLLNWFYWVSFTNRSTLTVNLSKAYLSQLPIRKIDFGDAKDVALHDKMVGLVGRLLLLKRKFDEESNPDTRRLIGIQIDSADKQIDKLTYELYDLSIEQVENVEISTSIVK